MDKFENYIKIKWYLVCENEIYLILKVIVEKVKLDHETQIFAVLRGKTKKISKHKSMK